MNNQKIGTFIKELRKSKGYTQKELAKKLNVTDRAVSKWERGLGCPDISLLEELSKILDVSVLEILRGERKENNKNIDNKDLIDSMKLSKQNTLDKIKNISNYIAVISVVIFILIIIISNTKSIYILNKKYIMKEKGITYVEDETILYEEYQNKVNIILNNQGIFSDEDYSRIRSNVKIMSERLNKQHNDKYIKKNNYSYIDLIQFYIDHENLQTIEIDNLELYKILIKYDTLVSDNMINYEIEDITIDKERSNFYFYLQQPYSIENILIDEYYIPNTNYIISNIYNREVMLLNDIIKVGEINE